MKILTFKPSHTPENRELNRYDYRNSHGRHIWRAPVQQPAPVEKKPLLAMIRDAEKDDVIGTFAVPLPEKLVNPAPSQEKFSTAVEKVIEFVECKARKTQESAQQKRRTIKARYADKVPDSAYLPDHQIPPTEEDQKASVLQDMLQDLKRISRYSDRIAPLPNAKHALQTVITGLKNDVNELKNLHMQDFIGTVPQRPRSV